VGAARRMTGTVVAVRVPDWSVRVAMRGADVGPQRPAAVHDGRRVLAVSAVARARGVRAGMRRRAAQEVCPDLELLVADPQAEARCFDEVAAAVEQVVARVTVVRPGLVRAPLPGPVGSRPAQVEACAAVITDAVARSTGDECVVGAAGTAFAAVVAAGPGDLVPADQTVAYLRRQPVTVLRRAVRQEDDDQAARLVELLGRLGVTTLGDLCALSASTVHARFGAVGLWAHRMASGEDDHPVGVWEPEQPLAVSAAVDPPALRSDTVTFLAAPLAERLQALLRERSLTCASVRVTAWTEDGGELTRWWKADGTAWGATTTRHVVDRVRWQLDGWLAREADGGVRAVDGPQDPPVAPVVRIEIAAEEVAAAPLQHEVLWGDDRGDEHRARRAVDRVCGMLGTASVFAAVPQGGRTPADRVRLVPWGQPTDHVRPVARPWPGSLPAPSPATVLADPVAAELLDGTGRPVTVGERLGMSADPVRVRVEPSGSPHDPTPYRDVTGWAGPWPVVERWWSAQGRRTAYLQVGLEDGTGLLLGYQRGGWCCEALYD